ncbi:LysR family transcriptional regulator [Propylenella binzhouense]|uniref:LysR family transcriptional regulator n=1 Tax=Propylenella binzhouense TaxID=2555902 RepID=A0A964WTY0_9HYPH|nr:LysR family transcriptional regulator [Propylenella binzhouense]MYZ48471.1 LysR family transcriptional regulator [Propylenella binzhouense]
MELRHLRYFVSVAEEGTLTRAAKRLGIQQPPLGQQIRALEEELKVDLFDRTPKRIVLNAAGEVFLQDVRRVLTAVEEMVQHVRRFERGEQGKVTIGFTSSASLNPVAPRVIRTFLTEFPYAELDVEERETYELLQGVLERRTDVAFIRVNPRTYDDLEAHVLDEEPFVAAIPAGHALAAAGDDLPLAALNGAPFILYPRRVDGPGYFDEIMAAMDRAGIGVDIVGEVSRSVSALSLVAAGQGFTIVPASLRIMHRESVVYREIRGQDLHRLPLYVVHRRDVDLRLARNFLATATRFARRTPAGA